uniref:Cathepsin propeptide inhibitor domain-containing protein n=1 Tax=Nothoprocta perdicaria TaxID=30464 RepID=A0A8C6ZE01_NOTPE
AAHSACLPAAELLFKAWMRQHNRAYGPGEYHRRLQIFADNKRQIDEHNAANHTFQMSLNQFSDMTFAEFKKKYLWSEPQNCSATKGNFLRSSGPSPDTIDWRKKGNFVTPVKNQVGSWSTARRLSTTTAAAGACPAKPSSTSATTRGSWRRTPTRTGTAPAGSSPTRPSLSSRTLSTSRR